MNQNQNKAVFSGSRANLPFIQLQGELLKQGRLDRSYIGVADCVKRTWAHEGILAFWRGNFASVVRYFPQQVPPETDEDAVLISIASAQLTVNWLMPHARHSFPTTWQSGSSRQIYPQLHFMHSPFSNSQTHFSLFTFFTFLFMIKSKMTKLTAKTDSLQFLIN